MKIRSIAAGSTLALSALVATGASASTAFTFQHGVAGWFGGAETTLSEADPDSVKGADVETSIDASDGGLPSQVLLRFDGLFGAGPGQVATDSIVTSATLTVVVGSAGSGIRFHDMLKPWNEATATWNTMMGGISADGIEASALPWLTIGANDSGANVEEGLLVLDVTEAVRRIQNGSVPGYGWALLPWMPDGTNGIDFYTKEWSTVSERPLLTIVAEPIPEPGTVALMLAGLAGVAGWARRARIARGG